MGCAASVPKNGSDSELQGEVHSCVDWAEDAEGRPVWHVAGDTVVRDDFASQKSDEGKTTASFVSRSEGGRLGGVPVWRVAEDPHGRELVWVCELIWARAHREVLQKKLGQGEWVGMIAGKRYYTTDREVMAHRFFAHGHCYALKDLCNALSFRTHGHAKQASEYQKDAAPVYLTYALNVATLSAEDKPHSHLHFAIRLLQKKLWDVEDAEQVVVTCSATIFSEDSARRGEVSHYGISSYPRRLQGLPRLGKGELSLKLHGFSSACILRDLAERYGSDRMVQTEALPPMTHISRLYQGFLAKDEEVRHLPQVTAGNHLEFTLVEAARDYFFGYQDPRPWFQQ